MFAYQKRFEKQVASLVKTLDDNSFAIREQSTNELVKLGEYAIVPLHSALSSGLALESESRVKKVLEILEKTLMNYLN